MRHHPLDTVAFIQQFRRELAKFAHIGHYDLEMVVERSTDTRRLDNFRRLAQHIVKFLEGAREVPLHRDLREHDHDWPYQLESHRRLVANDITGRFELFDAREARTRRERYPLRQLAIRDTSLGLQNLEDFDVDAVDFLHTARPSRQAAGEVFGAMVTIAATVRALRIERFCAA
jgi:hypothetical protein